MRAAQNDQALKRHDGSSIRVVFDWYTRRLTADRFANRQRIVVPPQLAGWVVPNPGEPFDQDGLRPLGAVRDRLLELTEDTGLTGQERTVLLARTGLVEYPTRRQSRPLAQRVLAQRRRRPGGLGERRMRMLHEAALARLDNLDLADPRHVEGIEAAPVPDPVRAPWFLERVPAPDRFETIERAVEAARAFVAASGYSGDVDRPIRDLDAYFLALQSCDWPPRQPLGRSRAHALVGLALWDLVMSGGQLGPRAAIGSGSVVPSAEFVCASEHLGALLAGQTDSATVLAACDDVLGHRHSHRHMARVMSDLLLGYYAQNRGRLGREVEATILRTVIRVRSSDEDPTVLGLVRRLIADYPLTWQAIDGAQWSVRVASGHRLFRRADELCRFVDAALDDGVSLPPDRDRTVENAEYTVWNIHQRTATLRRQLDLGIPTVAPRNALKLAADAHRSFDHVQVLTSNLAHGDATEAWRFYLDIRSAEIHLLVTLQTDGADARGHLRAAQQHALRADQLAKITPLSKDPVSVVPLLKVDLRAAVLLRNQELATSLLWRLHKLGWPMSRTVPAIRVAAARAGSTLGRALHDTIQEIRARESLDEGRSLVVDGTNRQRWDTA